MPSPENIWIAYHEELQNYFLTKTGDKDLAEDLTQEVFLKLVQSLPKLQDFNKVAHWLRTVAANTLKDHWKKEGRKLDETEWFRQIGQDSNMLAVAEKCVQHMIETLDPKYALALKRSEIDGIKQSELAQEMNISHSGAKSRVQRGRQLLKEAIIACCNPQLNERNELVDAECLSVNCDC